MSYNTTMNVGQGRKWSWIQARDEVGQKIELHSSLLWPGHGDSCSGDSSVGKDTWQRMHAWQKK